MSGKACVTIRSGMSVLRIPLTRPGCRYRIDRTPQDVCPQTLVDRALGAKRPRRPLIVLPDRTRWAHQDILLPPLLDRLCESSREKPRVLFASGTHPPVDGAEMQRLTAPVSDRVAGIAHDSDARRWTKLGQLPDGRPAHVHPAVDEADLIIVVSAMTFHYLAGLGGGRKMLVPGIASRETATTIHAVTLCSDPPGRSPGIGPGPCEHNPMHHAILRAVDSDHDVVGICMVAGLEKADDAEAGPLLEHHRVLGQRFVRKRTRTCPTAQTALVSCGGRPRDTDLIQAHKALTAVAPVLVPGARVALVAACDHGLGHQKLAAWLAQPASELLDQLMTKFHISKQTAWSLRSLFEAFDVGLYSSLPATLVRSFGATPLSSPREVGGFLNETGTDVSIFDDGAALHYIQRC